MGKDAKAADEAPPKKSKKLIIIALAAVLLLGGGGGGFLLLKPKKAEAKAAPTPGIVVVLDAQTINLADSHYLKLKMSLQMTADAGSEALDGSRALDLAIDQYSGRPIAQLFSTGYRKQTKADLLAKVGKAYDDKVMDIYFTTFVIQ
jgi:flagellar FliL protein